MPKVDLSHYQGREQAYIKHCLLEEYLPDWAYKVGSAWDSLVYVDGFAGPWQTIDQDYADSSFGIAVETLRQCQTGLLESRQRELRMQCILVDQDKTAFSHLHKFAIEKSSPGFGVHALKGEFVRNIPAIKQIVSRNTQNPFRFVFLDPKGWADIPMLKLQPFLDSRSCEVLINLMTRHIIRFLDEPDRASSYNSLFGRDEVLGRLQRSSLLNVPPYERAERAVREYCKSLRLLCNFKYVSSAVILEPDEESIRYFMVFASNHHRGVEVFKGAETKAAKIQDLIRHDAQVRKTRQDSLRFDNAPPGSRLSIQLRRFYLAKARMIVIDRLLSSDRTTGIPYSELFCEAMAFPLVTPDDLVSWLIEWKPNVRLLLAGKKPSPKLGDKVFVVEPNNIR